MASGDTFRNALAAEGLDDAAIQRVRDALRANYLQITSDLDRKFRDEREVEKQQLAAAAEGMPDYHGAIARCQAEVTFPGRVTEWSRCERKPKKVRRVKDDSRHGFQGDGRLAVCLQHSKATQVRRWVKADHWTSKGRPETASEIVESEYQP